MANWTSVSFSIVFVRAVNTKLHGVCRNSYFDLDLKNTVFYELITCLAIRSDKELVRKNCIKTVYDLYRFWASTSWLNFSHRPSG
jgi:hypothetical protein